MGPRQSTNSKIGMTQPSLPIGRWRRVHQDFTFSILTRINDSIKKIGSYARPFGTGEWYAVNADGSQPRPLIFYGTRDATQRGKQGGDLARIRGAGGRQHHAMARALEQLHAKKTFQRCNLARHGALRQRQFARGMGIALMARRRFKTVQRLQHGNFSGHGRPAQ